MMHLIEILEKSGIKNAEQEFKWLKQYARSSNELNMWVNDRINGKPMAYIIGHVDFYGLELIVNESVLIPRAETEEFVELIIKNTTSKRLNIIDLGCGSGAIALALKTHLPDCQVFGVDLSASALAVAKKNQKKHPQAHIEWIQSNWLNAIDLKNIDMVVSNPPYVESSWIDSSIQHEPKEALYSGPDGLDDIRSIFNQCEAHKHLQIWFEHGHNHDLSQLICSPWNIEKYFDHSGTQRFSYLSCR
jgi:release factor glutamine methyltransferase